MIQTSTWMVTLLMSELGSFTSVHVLCVLWSSLLLHATLMRCVVCLMVYFVLWCRVAVGT